MKLKLTKMLALALAVLAVAGAFVSCNRTPEETPSPTIPDDDPSHVKYSALVGLQVMDWKNNVVYETKDDDEDPYRYTSDYYAATIDVVLDDFAFMTDNFDCKFNSLTKLLESVTVTKRKKSTVYKAGEEVTFHDGVTKQKTYWVCYLNGIGKDYEVANMSETVLKDGDKIYLRLEYKDMEKNTPPAPTGTASPSETGN
ncbi:MAG: hypothetical protein MSA49_02925 [Clostridia bacterium]|nr:hypothetical protein [Clostridia bacterium]